MHFNGLAPRNLKLHAFDWFELGRVGLAVAAPILKRYLNYWAYSEVKEI